MRSRHEKEKYEKESTGFQNSNNYLIFPLYCDVCHELSHEANPRVQLEGSLPWPNFLHVRNQAQQAGTLLGLIVRCSRTLIDQTQF